MNTLTPSLLRRILHAVSATQPHEIDCDECFGELHRYAEATLAGRPITDAMLLVKQHLERCKDCREEFEALLVMLQQSADPT